MWENLHKTNGMDVGQIGFHKQKAVRKIRLASRENVIVNRLNKTKVQGLFKTNGGTEICAAAGGEAAGFQGRAGGQGQEGER